MIDIIIPEPMSASYDESLTMAKALDAQVKECYYNSFTGCITMTVGIPQDRIFYVEGVAIDTLGIPMEHGWMKVDGQIIDPTWVLIHDQVKLAGVVYFPAITYSMEDIKAALKATDNSRRTLRLPVFIHIPGRRGVQYDNRYMARAMEAAYRYSLGDAAVDALVKLRGL